MNRAYLSVSLNKLITLFSILSTRVGKKLMKKRHLRKYCIPKKHCKQSGLIAREVSGRFRDKFYKIFSIYEEIIAITAP